MVAFADNSEAVAVEIWLGVDLGIVANGELDEHLRVLGGGAEGRQLMVGRVENRKFV